MPFRHPGSIARPDVLVCAGLDPSGGAGLIADTRVLHDLGARPVGIVTALTVQNTTGVVEWHASDPEVIGHQLAFLMTDIEVKAVKIGMIGSPAIARAIASALHLTNAPVVWDPVAGPSLGSVAYADSFDDVVTALRPHLALVTPNIGELALLSRMPIDSLADAEAAAKHLAHQLDCAVLVKSGHLVGPEAVDLLITASSREEFHGTRIANGERVHGTGCALSSAIAAYLAAGRALPDACREAKAYVAERIAHPVSPGRGAPSVI
ncbi:MAG: hydroxymethylpyrimidine/phosphomethylpyrimidine kinase [Kofleriaceae bacterium]